MLTNDALRFHIINVGHGDSILVELPDARQLPRFGLVDAGGEDAAVRDKTLDYVRAFVEARLEGTPSATPSSEDYAFEFICLTHPHADHCMGMLSVLEAFCGPQMPRAHWPKQFWDCGFRYNTTGYLAILQFLSEHRQVQFVRVTSGTEFHFDDVEVLVLAPSIDMRNRYDTYGVDVNDASIILRVTRGRGVALLAGDAHFDTWGKVCEEFPRESRLVYAAAGVVPGTDGTPFESQVNQLNCQFLKVAHHGSKRGTSFEYIEKLSPAHFAISCDGDAWYQHRHPNWVGKFPHPITRLIIGEELSTFDVADPAVPDVPALGPTVGTTVAQGTMIYTIRGNGQVIRQDLGEARTERVDAAGLRPFL